MDFILSKVDPDFVLNLFTKHVQGVKESLASLNSVTSKWPDLPSDVKEQPTGVKLNNYQQAFDTLQILLTPEENSKYQQIIDLRKQIEKTKADYKNLLEQKEKIGPEKCLEKAKEYKALLQKQTKLESTYLEVLLHKWRTAITAFETELKTVQK